MAQYLEHLISNIPQGYLLGSKILLVVGLLWIPLGLLWVFKDYHGWVAFGTGGTPPTWAGYWKITKYRILRAFSGDDLKDASRLPSAGQSHMRIILQQREPPVPLMMSRTLPQRQVPAQLDQKLCERLHSIPREQCMLHSEFLELDKSLTEGRTTDAIYARSERPGRQKSDKDPVLGDEIAHVHPQDNSLHVWLSLADTKKVVDAGWGQRFPLASLRMVHEGWTFIYAPRSSQEVDVIEEIVKAGIRHLTGEQL